MGHEMFDEVRVRNRRRRIPSGDRADLATDSVPFPTYLREFKAPAHEMGGHKFVIR